MAVSVDSLWQTPSLELLNTGNRGNLSVLPAHKLTISAVIPTLNEAENLPHVLPRIPAWVDEVIVVDGRSTDNTVEVAERLLPGVRIVLETRKGKGAALRAGFAAATGDIIVMLDADGSTDPAEISNFVWALLSGADFAKGSRYLQGGGTADMSLHRQFGNWGFTRTVKVLFGGQYSDLCYGYNAFWARVLPHLDLDADGFEIETLMNVRALKAGLKVTEVPSFEAERINGTSNLNAARDGWRVLMTIVRESVRPGPRQPAPEPVRIQRVGALPQPQVAQQQNRRHASDTSMEVLQLLAERRRTERRRENHPEVVQMLGEDRRRGERRMLSA